MKKARIILMDDEARVRATVARILESVGHEVVQAGNGEEGLEHCRARPADLVVTDLYMPKKEGLETIKELRVQFPGTPVVAISGGAVAGTMLSVAKALGAFEVLEKPFAAEQLLAVVDKALDSIEGR
jgi:DNA-binding NtrC family response regulator